MSRGPNQGRQPPSSVRSTQLKRKRPLYLLSFRDKDSGRSLADTCAQTGAGLNTLCSSSGCTSAPSSSSRTISGRALQGSTDGLKRAL